jgi:hypothetical protein
MIVRRVVIVSLIVAIGIVATGTSLAATTKPLTKAQFVKKANALCDAARTAFVPVGQEFASLRGGNPTSAQITAFIDLEAKRVAGIVQTQITKTAALKPPKRDQSKITKFLHENQTDLDKLKADPQLLFGEHSPFLAADSLARAYGLEGAAGSDACTQGSSGGSTSAPTST